MLALVLALSTPCTALGATTALDSRGIGPLKLGMSRSAAVATGRLSNRGTGCQLGGRPYPVTYRERGSKAPAGLRGSVEFVHEKLTDMSFTGGVRTSVGIVVGRSTVSQMVHRYRQAGFRASSRFDSTFAGTFVTVSRKSTTVFGGFASGKVIETLAIPNVPVCE